MMNNNLLISSLKELPRFEGSHCPNQSDHEYIKRVDDGKYVRLEDVLKVITNDEKKGRDPYHNYEF